MNLAFDFQSLTIDCSYHFTTGASAMQTSPMIKNPNIMASRRLVLKPAPWPSVQFTQMVEIDDIDFLGFKILGQGKIVSENDVLPSCCQKNCRVG
jgi:hypothetical protein